MAGLDEVPALVREVPDEAALAMALIENIQREDLNPLEEAAGHAAPGRRVRHDARAGRRGGRPLAQRRHQPAAPAQARQAGAGDADGGRARDGPRARAARARRARARSKLGKRVAAKGLSVRETEALVQRDAARPGGARRSAPTATSRGWRRKSPSAWAPRSRSAPERKAAASWCCITPASTISTSC